MYGAFVCESRLLRSAHRVVHRRGNRPQCMLMDVRPCKLLEFRKLGSRRSIKLLSQRLKKAPCKVLTLTSVSVEERKREREFTPFQPHRADAGAARTSPGRYHNRVFRHWSSAQPCSPAAPTRRPGATVQAGQSAFGASRPARVCSSLCGTAISPRRPP